MPSLTALHQRCRDALLGWTSLPTQGTESPLAPGHCHRYFVLVILFSLFYPLAMHGSWILQGGMWAEMSANYYALAESPSLLLQLFGPDSGYIPIVQRLLALAGHLLHLPAAVIPLYYTGSALIGGGFFIAVFCLAPFRALIASDRLRFVLGLTALLLPDFETRSFINFTYLGAWPLIAVTALAWTRATQGSPAEATPAWVWALLPLAFSKPAVLALVPAMLLAALVADRRFRRFALVFALLCLIQLVILKLGRDQFSAGVEFVDRDASLGRKLLTLLELVPGFFGGYLAGPIVDLNNTRRLILGVLVLGGGAVVVFRRRALAPLTLVGLVVLIANVGLNAFALSRLWTPDMNVLSGLPVHRHIIFGFFATLLLVGQAAQSLGRQVVQWRGGIPNGMPGLVIFCLWGVVTGWLYQGTVNARLPDVPVIGNSRWLTYAEAIDSGQRPLCVPVDPFGWVFGRDCLMLNPEVAGWPRLGFGNWAGGAERAGGPGQSSLTLTVPGEVPPHAPAGHLLSLALPIRPATPEEANIHLEIRFHLGDGTLRRWDGHARLGSRGGLISAHGQNPVDFKAIEGIELLFSEPVQVFQVRAPNDTPEAPTRPAVMWMGN